MKLELARHLAGELSDLLRPYCERIEIAGGIRRNKPEPHDIELVAVPRMRKEVVSTPLGTTVDTGHPLNSLDERMHLLDTLGTIQRGDPSESTRKSKVIGVEKVLIRAPFGDKLYRVKYRGEKVDLFVVTPPAQWGPVFAIRTGDKDYSHWLVQQGYPRGVHEDKGHLEKWIARRQYHEDLPVTVPERLPGMLVEVLQTPEEEDFFKALGVPWVEPERRTYEATRGIGILNGREERPI